MSVSGFKRCKCRDDDGREFGAKCERLHRSDESWNPGHGTWYGKAELTPAPDKSRVSLTAGGFATQEKMTEWFAAAVRLLEIPEAGPDGHKHRMAILGLVRESRKVKADLPDYDDIRRRYAEGAAYRLGTTGSYLLSWLDQHRQAGDWAPTTMHLTERAVSRLFLPVFGDVPLDKLRSRHVLDMLAGIDAENERVVAAQASDDAAVRKSVAGRRTAGPSSKRRYLAVLTSALAEAMAPPNRLITTNAAAGIKIGRTGKKGTVRAMLWTAKRERAWRDGYEARLAAVETPTRAQAFALWRNTAARPGPVMVWTPAHFGQLLDSIEDDRLYPIFCVIGHCALRRGEAVGLPWTETDLDDATMTITSQIVQVGWQAQTAVPKTDASLATVKIDEVSLAALKVAKKDQRAERLAFGPGWINNGLVFTRADGSAYHPAYVTTRFEHMAFDAGLPPLSLHGLRHTAATLALAAGADITAVSRLLRHSSIQITADIYTEVLPELAAEVSAKVVAIVPRRGRRGAAV